MKHAATKANVTPSIASCLDVGGVRVKTRGKMFDGLGPVETPTSQPQSSQCHQLDVNNMRLL